MVKGGKRNRTNKVHKGIIMKVECVVCGDWFETEPIEHRAIVLVKTRCKKHPLHDLIMTPIACGTKILKEEEYGT